MRLTNNNQKTMITGLNHVDLCFVVDTTGSMGTFIQAAQRQLLNTISLLSADKSIDLQIGLVEYRDHPPQDQTFITRVYPLTTDMQAMQSVINKLRADGGGDAPEAVYDGIHDACKQMRWRKHSCRFILLVGDAPPHGFAKWLKDVKPNLKIHSSGDTWANGCPSGLNVQAVTALAETYRVTIHTLCMVGDLLTKEAFTVLAQATGGECATASNASEVISKITAVLKDEFFNLEFDGLVLATVEQIGHLDISETAVVLQLPRLPVATAVARLGKRGFL
ncbi:hypothetical protein NIES4101_38770 [Calothrix sp. NIES-4101]|nr:hypothetical protein NIES4101_38770 [Calothrix sp. NIES-4101]